MALPLAFSTLNYTVLTVYMVTILIVGYLCSRKNETAEDYFLAGRSMPSLVVAMSMFASLTSAVTFMGVPNIAYGDNVSIILGVMVSPLVAPILITLFYPVYWRNKVVTSYDYIAKRFGNMARWSASALFILTRLGWLGTVIYAPAIVLNVATGISIQLAIAMMGIIATLYTIAGGLRAVLWTDVFQFLVLVVGAIWIAANLATNLTCQSIFTAAAEAGKFDIFNWNIDFKQMTAVAAMVSFFCVFMYDYGVDQITVQRLISVKSFKGLSKAIIFNSVVDVVINGLLLFIGLGMFLKYQNGGLGEGINGSAILPFYIINELPNGISGLVIAGIFAAAMSSMDSGLNSISTVVVNDFVMPFRKELSDKDKIKMGKLLTLALGTLATLMAYYAKSLGHIVEAWSSFMGLFAAPVLAMFLLGLLVKQAKFIDWIIAALPTIIVMNIITSKDMLHWVYMFPVALIMCLILALLACTLRHVLKR